MRTDLLNRYVVLIVGLLTMSLTPVWGSTYTITFKTATTDGSTEIGSSTKSSTVISAGTDYVSGFTSSCSKAYYNGKNGVKLGSSSSAGTLEFNIATAYQSNIKKITVKSAKYGSDNGTLSLYSGSTSLKTGISPGTDYTHTFATPTTVTSIKLKTSAKRAYISEVIIETDQAPAATITLSVAGEVSTVSDKFVGDSYTLPNEVSATCGTKKFVGWSTVEIANPSKKPASNFYAGGATVTLEENNTFYAVFATETSSGSMKESLSQTLQYDTWTYSGSTTNKSSYRLFHTDSYIESAEFDLSTLSKVVVYGGTFGGTSYKNLNIGDGTNTWKDVTVSGSDQNGVNTYIDGTSLSGKGKLRVTSKSGTASSTGVRISKVEIYTRGGASYSDYTTSCSTTPTYTAKVDPAPENGTILISSNLTNWNSSVGGLTANQDVYFIMKPNEGYSVTSYSTSPATTILDMGSTYDGYPVYGFDMPAADVTVSATFTCPTVTLTFQSPSKTETKTVSKCEAIGENLPTAPASCSDTYTHFVGWFTTPAGSDSNPDATAPATKVTAETIPTGDATYHAVFSDAQLSGELTLATTLTNGDKIYLATSPTGTGVTGANSNNKDATVSTDKATWMPFTVTYYADGTFKLKNGTNYVTGASGSFKLTEEGTTLTLNENGYFTFTISSDTYCLMQNTNSGTFYRCYKTTNINNNAYTQFFMYKAGTPATGYISSCCSDPAKVTITPASSTVNLGADGKATTAVTCSQLGGDDGEWTYSVSPADATFNGTTFTATKAGTYTLTATYEETCPKSAKTTITVTATPTLYFTTEPANPIVFDDPKCGGNTPLEQKKSVALQGYNLTGNVTVTVSGDYKIARTSSAELGDYATEITLNKTAEGKIHSNYQTIYILSTPPAAKTDATVGTLTITTEGGNTLTVNLSTPTITCAEYTLTFMDQGGEYKKVTQYAGTDVAEPKAPTGVCTEPTEYIFDGWAEASVAEGSTSYTKVTFPYTMPKNGATLYAVYRYEKADDVGWKLVTDLSTVAEGTYAILSTDYVAFNGSISSGNGQCTTTGFTFTDGVADVAPTGTCEIQMIASSDGYLMYNADKGYLYAKDASSGNLAWSTTVPTSYWKYGGSTNNNWVYATNGAYLRYYNSTIRTYGKNSGNVLQLAKKGGSYAYTSDPACGPHIGLSGDVRITSAKGVRVDAYTKITVSGTNLDKNEHSAAVSIKAESNNPNFKIKRWGTTGDGNDAYNKSWSLATNIQTATYTDSLCITYTPTAANTTESATITLTAYKYNGTTPYATKTITVLGHSLPERFVIAAKGTDGWVALPNTLGSNSSAKIPNVEDINGDVDDSNNPTKLTTAPSNVIYTAAARGDSYKDNSQTGLRFTVDGGQFLQASDSATTVWLSTTNSKDMQSWTLRTEDFVNYQVRLDSAEEGRYLAYNKNTQYNTERIGHYKTNTAIRFLPFDKECTRLLAPANLKVTLVKSSAITLAWDAVAGAIGYAYSTDDGTTWTEMGNVLTYTITGLTAAKVYTILVKGVVPVGDTDCSYYGTVSATTTNCDDVPQNISYTSDVNSITLSWTMTSAKAIVRVYSNNAGTTQVGNDYTNATSPYTIKGLTKATTYYVKILAGGSCPSELIEISTERPQLDVVEWKPNGIDVAINTNEKISVILENQVTKGTGTGQVANELFFSKYYEATGNVKLIAIYNGTLEEKDLRKYRISIGTDKEGWTYAQIGASDFETMGKTTLQSNEELVLYYYEGSALYDPKIIECVNNNKVFDFSTAYKSTKISYSGRQNFLLEKTEDGGTTYEKIDLMGAMDIDGTNLEPKEGVTGACTPSWGDITKSDKSYRTWCGEGPSIDQYEVDGKENIIPISMNRCLLIRKKTVLDGYNAVAKNIGSFYTLGGISETVEGEWLGRQVEKGTDNGVSSSCAGFEYVGGFDYNKFYTTYNLLKDTVFDDTKRNPDGTMTINIPRMDTLACKGLKIIAKDKGGNVLTTKEYRVPILVTRDATTADPVFFHFEGDTCKTCDVVVRDKATLTKAAKGAPNDKPQVRDVKIYEGASLVVPGGTNYTVNSLSLRRKEDAVSTVDVAGTLTFSNTSGKPVYLDLRINAENWHWFTLPYECAIADVTWSNGQPAEFRKDWFLMDYDGARRATGVDSGNWKEYEGTTIAAGQGFIVGIKGDGNDKHAYELRFPMVKEVITDDATNKNVEVYAYGAGTEVRPNHKGWNLVGNPYLNYYQKDHINSFGGLRLGLLVYDAVTGWWSVSATDSDPYIVIPQNFGWSAYKQVLVSSQDLLPFTSYFIQVGKDEGYTDGQRCEVQFTSGNRGRSAKAALMTSAAEEAEEEPVITGIVLRNAQGEQDETSLVIAERFGSSYEMGADFFKWFGDYYKYYTLPVLYSIGDDGGKRAFNAVNEEGAKQSIPLGMYAARDGQYTFSLNTRSDLSRVDKVWLYDAESGRYTDLLREDYTFATMRTEGSGRFFLSVVLKEKEITTSAANAPHGDLTLYADKQTLIVRGLPEAAEVWVYDPSGKLLHHEQTRHYERQYDVPQQGTYLVRVESKDGGVTLRGICR